jgi:hypothetical protein
MVTDTLTSLRRRPDRSNALACLTSFSAMRGKNILRRAHHHRLCAGNAVASAAAAAAAKGQGAFTSANASAAALQVSGAWCSLAPAADSVGGCTLRQRADGQAAGLEDGSGDQPALYTQQTLPGPVSLGSSVPAVRKCAQLLGIRPPPCVQES